MNVNQFVPRENAEVISCRAHDLDLVFDAFTTSRSAKKKHNVISRGNNVRTDILLVPVLLLMALVSGCASVTGSTTQNVSVQTRETVGGDLPGAVCELSNSKGKWFVTTPGSVMIHRSNDDMQILCNKAGYETGRTSVISNTKAEMFGNIILGGVIGAVIDHNSGSGYEYPEFIQVLLRAFSRPDQVSPNQQAPLPVSTVPAPAVSATQRPPELDNGLNPQVGDTWTYRYSDGYGRSETYKVNVTSVMKGEIRDEIRLDRSRNTGSFAADLELVPRGISGLNLREFSPYLLSLGPQEFSNGWVAVKLFDDSKPFAARFVGSEIVSVPAGVFDSRKLVVDGVQFIRGNFMAALSRKYTVTVWYAPTAKRFVKLSIAAPEVGMASSLVGAERDTIELLETSIAMPVRQAIASPIIDQVTSGSPPGGAGGQTMATQGLQAYVQGMQQAGSGKAIQRSESSTVPKIGDSWTYRFTDSFGKTGTYTVQVKSASSEEVSDELRMGRARDASTFSPGLSLTDRKAGEFALREISPYLLSLGPTEPTAEWSRVAILNGSEPFSARLAGIEHVQVQAGTFEARKVIIEGRQTFNGSYYYGVPSRTYTATIWYAPAVKRFVKLAYTASGGGHLTPEKETIELLETNIDIRYAGKI